MDQVELSSVHVSVRDRDTKCALVDQNIKGLKLVFGVDMVDTQLLDISPQHGGLVKLYLSYILAHCEN